ncbi:hypothetical protein [Bradyrhizobium sp. URHD0069]|uniref:hypothetical protein n=1 Tax=Bradyrhizobium sp. URHD0069 TaxID=1380355 RepID=UPI0012DF0023|nr:hypothetical protein [Bradyrhizobium sp. URHD0069]
MPNNNITQQSLTGFAISTITVGCALLRTTSLTETNFADSVHHLSLKDAQRPMLSQ